MRYLSFCLLLFGIFGFSISAHSAQKEGVCYEGKVLGGEIQSKRCDGATLGTVGQSLPLEWMKIYLPDSLGAGICTTRYRAHVQNIGWMDWATGYFDFAGTMEQGLRLEAFEATIENCPSLTLRYRAHVQDIGWMDWVEAGEVAGTTGQSLRLEAIQVTVENTAPHYNYQGRNYPFYDIESGEVFLPLLHIAKKPESGSISVRYTQTHLSPIQNLFSFSLDTTTPTVTSSVAYLSPPIRIPETYTLQNIDHLHIPNLVVHSTDVNKVDIYDVLLEEYTDIPNQYQLKKINHLPVPVSLQYFKNCSETNIPNAYTYPTSLQYIRAQINAYLTYELATGKAPADNNKGLAVMSCCSDFLSSLPYIPANTKHDNGAYCINIED